MGRDVVPASHPLTMGSRAGVWIRLVEPNDRRVPRVLRVGLRRPVHPRVPRTGAGDCGDVRDGRQRRAARLPRATVRAARDARSAAGDPLTALRSGAPSSLWEGCSMGRQIVSRILCAAVVGLLATLGLQGQTAERPAPPRATFRSGVDLITLNVTVTDREHRFVANLDQRDFTILE